MSRWITGLTVLSLLGVTGASAQEGIGMPVVTADREITASAVLVNPSGDRVGTVELVQTPNSGVLIRLDVRGLEPGTHGFHIHETGQCTTPDFTSAGGHYAPRGRSHGVRHPHGAHAGDLLNIHVPESGRLQTERLAFHATLVPGTAGFLLDDDGSAVVIHGGADDYTSQPSGDAGPRVACGVIR